MRWINHNNIDTNKDIFLSIDLDYFYDKSWEIIIDDILRKNIATFVTTYHDNFLDIANLNWKKIINYDEHDDLAVFSELKKGSSWRSAYNLFRKYNKKNVFYTLEGCWVGMVKNKSSKEYLWAYPGKADIGICDDVNNLWYGNSEICGYKKIERRKSEKFDFDKWEKWNNVGTIGISLSPDYALTNVYLNFIKKFGIKRLYLRRE